MSSDIARHFTSLGLIAAVVFTAQPAQATQFDTGYLPELMAADPERFEIALTPAKAAEHRIQALVSFVRRSGGKKILERHGYRVDAEYFYPASAVKTCAAIAALATMRKLRQQGHPVSLNTPLVFHPLFPGDTREDRDRSNRNGGHITLGHLIRQMSIVSSNRAFNRLYDIAGHRALNQRMHAAGLADTHFIHRLSQWRPPEEHRKTPRIDLRTRRGTVTIPERDSLLDLSHEEIPGLEVGAAHIAPTGKRIAAPMSFARKNRMSLVDLQNMLVMVVRPDIELGRPGFDLHRRDRAFLKKAMRQRPGESKNPRLPESKYDPTRFKPVLPGLLAVFPLKRWTVWNKAGKAYGFRIENAYVVDNKTQRGFFFTVAIYANENQVLNDGRYQYDRISDPFIHALAEAVVRDRWRLRR